MKPKICNKCNEKIDSKDDCMEITRTIATQIIPYSGYRRKRSILQSYHLHCFDLTKHNNSSKKDCLNDLLSSTENLLKAMSDKGLISKESSEEIYSHMKQSFGSPS